MSATKQQTDKPRRITLASGLTYKVTSYGWTLEVKASRGKLITIYNPDGSVTIAVKEDKV